MEPINNPYSRWDNSAPGYLQEARDLFAQRSRRWFDREPGASDPEGRKVLTRGLVLRYGVVVWGLFVRAFWPAYMVGRNNHYGTVILSFDAACEDVQPLVETSVELRQLRQPVDVPAKLKKFVTLLRNDYKARPRLLIPRELSSGRKIYFQSILVERGRLPTHYLHHRLVPVMAHPFSGYATLLPLRFWPEELKATWREGEPPLSEEELARYVKGSPNVRP